MLGAQGAISVGEGEAAIERMKGSKIAGLGCVQEVGILPKKGSLQPNNPAQALSTGHGAAFGALRMV